MYYTIMMGSTSRPPYLDASPSWSQQQHGYEKSRTKQQQQQKQADAQSSDCPLTPPQCHRRQCSPSNNSGDESPVSRFRKDALSNPSFQRSHSSSKGLNGSKKKKATSQKQKNQPKQQSSQCMKLPRTPPRSTSATDEILKIRSVASRIGEEEEDENDHDDLPNRGTFGSQNLHSFLHGGEAELEDTESLMYLEQAREAIFAVTEPEASRLSDDRLQQILVAAMRYEKDHAPTVASRQPLPTESTSSIGLLESNAQLPVLEEIVTPPRYFMPDLLEDKKVEFSFDGNSSLQALYADMERTVNLTYEPNHEPLTLPGETPIARAGPFVYRADDMGMQDLAAFAETTHTIDPSTAEANQNGRCNGLITVPFQLDRGEANKIQAPIFDENSIADALHTSQRSPREERSGIRDNGRSFENRTNGVPIMIQLPSPPSMGQTRNQLEIHGSTGSGTEEEKKETNGKVLSMDMEPTQQPRTDADPSSRPKEALSYPEPSHDLLHSTAAFPEPKESDHDIRMVRSASMTESDVGSYEGLPPVLQTSLMKKESEDRDELLQKLDGVAAIPPQQHHTPPRQVNRYENRSDSPSSALSQPSCFRSIGLSCIWPDLPWNDMGMEEEISNDDAKSRSTSSFTTNARRLENHQIDQHPGYWDEKADEAFELFGHCSAIVKRRRSSPGVGPTTYVPDSGENPLPCYADAVRVNHVDTRLQSWVNSHYMRHRAPPSDGTYDLGRSRTVVVHEIARGDWTWCTVWSPRGDRLAVATENHHLAVIETTASTVWRVRHDRRLKGPASGDTTHSIRSLAWGKNFIAAGGTGNAVSILSPIEPYDVLHLIKGTGFVGTLDWRKKSNLLAIGSRTKKLMIVRVKSSEDGEIVETEIVFSAEFENWVNRVKFSPNGSYLAVGNASGVLTVYHISEIAVDEEKQEIDIKSISSSGASSRAAVEVTKIKEFKLDDSVLALDWSPDGQWLYAGGEDYHIAIIETTYWEIVHKIPRERWVQCIASSNGGTHLAVGGVSSEISLLDVQNGWDSVMGIELKGLVPLSASWHPKDQALALTGQNNSILVVETTNARHVKGHHLHSVSPIISVCFAPDGRTAVIGNEAGIVTFFSLHGSTFESTYEIVVVLNERLSVDWSLNGLFAVIGSKDSLIIVGPNTRSPSFVSSWKNRWSQCGSPTNRAPPMASPFSIQKVIRNIGETNGVSIDPRSRYVAVAGDRTRVYDASKSFSLVKVWKTGVTLATAWSPDGNWLASIGSGKVLWVYDTSDSRFSRWRSVFSLKCDFNGYALAWAPHIVGGLVYLAYGGSSKIIYIMEIRTLEGTWETVLRIPRDGHIRDLDWGANGLLAAGIDNGTVSIIDLAYLLSGVAVNEKDYNWQRQALTCYTEIRRNRGRNAIQAVRWIPTAPGSDSLLAVGGTDGEMEIVDLTERRNCRGYHTQKSPAAHRRNHQHPPLPPQPTQTLKASQNSPPVTPITSTTTTISTLMKYEGVVDKT